MNRANVSCTRSRASSGLPTMLAHRRCNAGAWRLYSSARSSAAAAMSAYDARRSRRVERVLLLPKPAEVEDRPHLLDDLSLVRLERQHREPELGREAAGADELRSRLGADVESPHLVVAVRVLVDHHRAGFAVVRQPELLRRHVRAEPEVRAPARRERRERHAGV